jgi:hypothetical protein
MNGALDYMGGFNITGGTLLATGSAGMAEAPGAGSGQNSLLINLNGTLPAGSLIHLQTSDGGQVFTFETAKPVQSIVFSSAQLQLGAAYDLYLGGSTTGTTVDGWVQGGEYSGGELYVSLTLDTVVTTYGAGGGRGGGRKTGIRQNA